MLSMNLISDNQVSRFINVVKDNLNEKYYEIFKNHFLIYLKYGNESKEFIVDFNKVVEYCGFSRKDHAKHCLTENFDLNIDYIISTPCSRNPTDISSKFDKTETIKLTIRCFKKFCMVCRTKQAKELYDYYLDIEIILFNFIINETNNIKIKEIDIMKLEHKNDDLLNKNINQQGIYFMRFIKKDEEYDNNNLIFKIGYTSDITERVKSIIDEYNNFDIYLYYFRKTNHYVKTEKNIFLNNFIKNHKYIYENKKELICINNDEIDKVIDIINKHIDFVNDKNEEKNVINIEYEKELTKRMEIEMKKSEIKLKEDNLNKEHELKIKKEENENLRLQIELKKLQVNDPIKKEIKPVVIKKVKEKKQKVIVNIME